jgi:hypothetical protein
VRLGRGSGAPQDGACDVSAWSNGRGAELLRAQRARRRREALLNISAWIPAWLLRVVILVVVIFALAFCVTVAMRLASR